MGAERTEGDGGGPVDATECPGRERHCVDVDDVQLRFTSDRSDKVQVVLGTFPLEAGAVTKPTPTTPEPLFISLEFRVYISERYLVIFNVLYFVL